MSRKRRKAPEPLPPLEKTLKELELLALSPPESKARLRRVIKVVHRVLAEVLVDLNSCAPYENLISPLVMEGVHRTVRRRLRLNKLRPTTPAAPDAPSPNVVP